jgi:hypothetical protein
MGVQLSQRRDTCELTIMGAVSGKSFVTLSTSGQARWYYEPAAGPLTSPARPWLGTVTLSDDAALDWRLDWRAAFGENPATLVDVIAPILRTSHTERLPR